MYQCSICNREYYYIHDANKCEVSHKFCKHCNSIHLTATAAILCEKSHKEGTYTSYGAPPLILRLTISDMCILVDFVE